jgi:hypothetical protein
MSLHLRIINYALKQINQLVDDKPT